MPSERCYVCNGRDHTPRDRSACWAVMADYRPAYPGPRSRWENRRVDLRETLATLLGCLALVGGYFGALYALIVWTR